MKILKTIGALQEALESDRKNGKTVGFSPTMGALHKGHISLIQQSRQKCDVSVCSIFVNPTQFNESADLEKYPRDLLSDSRLLEENQCDYLFAPTLEEIYPEKFQSFTMDLEGLDSIMEGEKRPGHFKGMIEVVHRLLDIIKPNFLFMGQKDFQQFTLVQHMIQKVGISTELVVCPIMREKDGLAMSSRNVRIDPLIRPRACNIYKTLTLAKDWLSCMSVEHVIMKAMNALSIRDFRPEYFEIVDGLNLERITKVDKHNYIVACTAVWAGDVRLIDNMIYKSI